MRISNHRSDVVFGAFFIVRIWLTFSTAFGSIVFNSARSYVAGLTGITVWPSCFWDMDVAAAYSSEAFSSLL